MSKIVGYELQAEDLADRRSNWHLLFTTRKAAKKHAYDDYIVTADGVRQPKGWKMKWYDAGAGYQRSDDLRYVQYRIKPVRFTA